MLYRSERTHVSRVPGPDGRPVIRKELLGPDGIRRARREGSTLDRLAGVPGVARRAGPAEAHVLLLEDAGDVTLAALAGGEPMPVAPLLALARELTAVVAGVHRAGIVHKDINPANVMIVDDSPVLIDFELATAAVEDRPGFTHESMIAGTLPYLAPEQTGRTGRAVDQRSDLYSLGATLYELATGRPPFGGAEADPLRLIHDQLARVPEPAGVLNPGLPGTLTAILARLLQKEPDQRYQSAEGLAYDLDRVGMPALVLGERDFPVRLVPPSRPVGRDEELQRLHDAFSAAAAGVRPGLLITGPPGVGKSSLIDELRPAVTALGGWLITGKFDQYRHDLHSDGLAQLLQGLGRLLLAEPDEALDRLIPDLLAAAGPNAGMVATLLPAFGELLGVPPERPAGEQAELEARMMRTTFALLRVIVRAHGPLVMVADDLQWASGPPLRFVEQLLLEEIPGLLFVGAYREAEVDAAHPLTGMLERWARGDGPERLHLRNLPTADVALMLGEMLRMPPGRADGLAAMVGAHTGGNPFDTVEFVNGLRRDEVLVAGADGWRWDDTAVRTYVGDGDVLELLAARIAKLPRCARQLVKVMACLGGDAPLPLLQAAIPVRGGWLHDHTVPALSEGLVTSDDYVLRFRHDRVQQAAYGSLSPFGRRLMHLVLARRLALHPEFEASAAQQYLPAVPLVRDKAERHRVALLFRMAAATVGVVNSVLAEQYLAAALQLLGGESGELITVLQTERHRALCGLGRLDEADELWQVIERRDDPLSLAEAAPAQITGLTVRGRPEHAVDLGLSVLRRLGLVVPRPAEAAAEVDRGLDRLRIWSGRADQGWDTARAELADPRLTAAATIMQRMMPPSFFGPQTTMGWLVVTAQRLWDEHGPHEALAGALGHATIVSVLFRDDYRTGFDTVRHVLAVGAARGWEFAAGVGPFLASVSTTPWFEPVEAAVKQAQDARERLLQTGDLQFAVATFHTSVPSGVDCHATLADYATEVAAGVRLAARTGNEQAAATTYTFRELVRALTDGPPAPGFDETAFERGRDGNPMAVAYFHTTKALAAAVFGDETALVEHATAAEALLPFIGAAYSTSTVHLLCALAGVGDRTAHRDWLAARAADAPENFRHLVHFLDAERAWAAGERGIALAAYDAALSEVSAQVRPWQHALIAERHGLRLIEQGLDYLGRQLLADAARRYRAWGATGKVRALQRQHPFLRTLEAPRPGLSSGQTTTMAAPELDLLAVVEASRTLSSETNLDRLRARVAEVLGTLTGSTRTIVLLCTDGEWLLPGDEGAAAVPVDQAGAAGRVPLSVVRYVDRTRSPLLVDDATRDDRFARDPYLAGLDRCSLLVVPVLAQGTPRAMLLLENTLTRGAFTADRIDEVRLIAGQLAVSIENAQVYGSLERVVAERTEALRDANDRLEVISRTDPLTGLANRRQLDTRLSDAWVDGTARHQPLSIAMIDIDHFKLYNDRYGHLAGDACLQRVADALNATIRGSDLVARYGGEEFALILPGADELVAQVIAERAREAVQALREEHAAAPAGIVTVSIGVACVVPAPDGSPAGLLDSADAELYEAKRTGRNKVAVATLTG